MNKILIASTNQGKIQEITKIMGDLNGLNITLQSISDYDLVTPNEPYDDFMKNAIHKAQYYAKATKQVTLSDDSGLCIETLNGFPGVKTKDFVEECGDLNKAFSTLQHMLSETKNNTAYFQTAIAIYSPKNGQLVTHEAKDYGRLSFPARGTNGFGFDPIFIPQGFNQTAAELGLSVKNQISHRAKALNGVLKKLKVSYSDFF